MKTERSKALFNRAKRSIPGGVNSPVRAFKAVGGDPIFFKSAKGSKMLDEDGNSYIDMINSWGPMILGHANEMVQEAVIKAVENSASFGAPGEREVLIAELICDMVPSIESVRMVNSGTEATMSAVRVARGYTGRDKFLKFEGCYHGHGDAFLIAAGSGAMTMGSPDSPGVTEGTAKDTLLAPFNDLEAVEQIVQENKDEIAAIIIEPVAGNMGCVLPKAGFLEGLRTICDREGIVLIFDEVMTGFRLAKGGAQERLAVLPDLTTLGKIIGGGLPVGAYGGKKEIMDYVSPQGPVYQAGTLSGNPVAMAAGFATLSYLNDHQETYGKLESNTKRIVRGYKETLDVLGLKYSINQIGSMFSLFFTEEEVVDFATAKKCNTEKFGTYFNIMLQAGVYLAPSQFESLFVSAVLTDADIEHIIRANDIALKSIVGA
ncbi:MAG: glutamate-1-semialdehyde 2,1-aminomutase [Cyclobacteriaceae bacterium]